MPIIYNLENSLYDVIFLTLGFDFDPTVQLNYFVIFMGVRDHEIPGSKSRPFFFFSQYIHEHRHGHIYIHVLHSSLNEMMQ